MTDHRIVVCTAIAGGVDQLREPVHVSPRVDHVCFTDNPHLTSTHWDLRPFDERFENPTRTAKKPKILPHRYFPEYEVSVWIDGNQTVDADLAELAESSLENRSLALFRHPDGREDLYDEARACIRLGKDDPDTINRQVERYREAGFPGGRQIPMCTVLVRRHHDPDLVEAMEDWWREIGAGSRRDQVSFDYVTWRHELAYELIEGDVRANRFLTWRRHDAPERAKARRARLEPAETVVLSHPGSGECAVIRVLDAYRKETGEIAPADESSDVVLSADYFERFADTVGEPRLLDRDLFETRRVVVVARDPRAVLASRHRDLSGRTDLTLGDLRTFGESEVYGIERQSGFVLELLALVDARGEEAHLVLCGRAGSPSRRELRRLLAFFFGGRIDQLAFRRATATARNAEEEAEALAPSLDRQLASLPRTARLIAELNERSARRRSVAGSLGRWKHRRRRARTRKPDAGPPPYGRS